jgi:hypothetical protein
VNGCFGLGKALSCYKCGNDEDGKPAFFHWIFFSFG